MSRILAITSTFPQYAGDPRGQFLLRHLEHKAQSGARVRVLAPRTQWCVGELGGPCEVVRVPYAPARLSSLSGLHGMLENVRERPWRAALVPLLWRGLRLALEQQIRSFAPDLVTAHMLLPGGWIAGATCAPRNIPFELYGHGTDVDVLLALPAFLRARFFRWASRAAMVHLPSQEKLDRVRARLDGADVRLGVESMLQSVPKARPTPVVDSGAVLFMGRLIRQKGVDDLLTATAMLDPRPELHIAGDGPERQRLERQAHRLGLPVTFHGFVGAEPKEALFRRAAVVCVPSRESWSGLSEGAPLVIREAFAYGRPVVATRVGGIPELCTDGPATLVPAGAPQALGQALAGVLGRPFRVLGC